MTIKTFYLCLLVCFCSLASPAWPASKAAAATCQLSCDQTLASCEHRPGAEKKRCSRAHGICEQQCDTGKAKNPRSAKQQKLILCEQRCDLSRSSCERANVPEEQFCAAGQKSCRQRCR